MTECRVHDSFARPGSSAVLAAALAISACANKPDDNAQASAAGAATPGSQQDFVVNVGDRVFFETDSDRADAAVARDARQAGAVAAPTTASTPSPSKATPTSAARANTTSRSAPAARRPCATIWSRAASRRNRMRTISYGKERPVAVCNDISCWSQNRRAVTVLNASS